MATAAQHGPASEPSLCMSAFCCFLPLLDPLRRAAPPPLLRDMWLSAQCAPRSRWQPPVPRVMSRLLFT